MWISFSFAIAAISVGFIALLIHYEREPRVTFPVGSPAGTVLSPSWWVTDQWWDARLAEVSAAAIPVIRIPAPAYCPAA